MSGDKPLYPLRERRKLRTRQALLLATRELVAEKGFEDFTLEQVADRAEVHVQTLYRHFPTKSELLSAGALFVQEELERALKEERKDETTIEVWRTFIARHAMESDQLCRQFVVPVESSASWAIHVRYIELLSEGLAVDMGVDRKTDRRPFFLACMLKGAVDTLYVEWSTSGQVGKIKSKLLKTIDEINDKFLVELLPQKQQVSLVEG